MPTRVDNPHVASVWIYLHTLNSLQGLTISQLLHIPAREGSKYIVRTVTAGRCCNYDIERWRHAGLQSWHRHINRPFIELNPIDSTIFRNIISVRDLLTLVCLIWPFVFHDVPLIHDFSTFSMVVRESFGAKIGRKQ